MPVSPCRVRTQQIGERLASLLSTGFSGLLIAQFGIVERLAAAKDTKDMLPGVWIKPEEATYVGSDISGLAFDVFDRFRICYAEKIENDDDPLVAMTVAANSIMTALGTDATLGNLRATIGPDQVSESMPEGVEWFPPESLFLAEVGAPIRVVVVKWLVKWMNRGA